MIDVFVVAILTALVQLGFLASINPGSAAVFFALSVAFTMLSAQALDPRLIWDSTEPGDRRAWLKPNRPLREVEAAQEETAGLAHLAGLAGAAARARRRARRRLAHLFRARADDRDRLRQRRRRRGRPDRGPLPRRAGGARRAHRLHLGPQAGDRHRPHQQGSGALRRRRRQVLGGAPDRLGAGRLRHRDGDLRRLHRRLAGTTSPGRAQEVFQGLPRAPQTPAGTAGIRLQLRAPDGGSMAVGAPGALQAHPGRPGRGHRAHRRRRRDRSTSSSTRRTRGS